MLVLLLTRNVAIETYLGLNRHECIIIPSMSQFEERRDSLSKEPPDMVYFDGGSDISPSYYGEVNNGMSSSNSERDAFESEVFRLYKNTFTRFAGWAGPRTAGKAPWEITQYGSKLLWFMRYRVACRIKIKAEADNARKA